MCFESAMLWSQESQMKVSMLERKVPILWFILLPASLVSTALFAGAVSHFFSTWSRFEIVVATSVLYLGLVGMTLVCTTSIRETVALYFLPTWIGVVMMLTFLTGLAEVTPYEGLVVCILCFLPLVLVFVVSPRSIRE